MGDRLRCHLLLELLAELEGMEQLHHAEQELELAEQELAPTGGNGEAPGCIPPIAPATALGSTRCTFHARTLLNQRP